jgi:hypothetical protein
MPEFWLKDMDESPAEPFLKLARPFSVGTKKGYV